MEIATTTTNTPSAPPSTPFEHVAKRPRTGPSNKRRLETRSPRSHQPLEWVQSEENFSTNRQYSYAEWYGATTDYCWRCPEPACGAVWTLYPTVISCRMATGIAECCHHPGGSVRLSIPHQCETCWTNWKPSRALPGVDHPAFPKAGWSHHSSQ